MKIYIVLLRGINVGGKNKVPMGELRGCLEDLGYVNVLTYIASGNVIVQTDKSAEVVKAEVEKSLPLKFQLDSELIKVLVLTQDQLQSIVDSKPENFGDHPEKYHSDVIFLMDVGTKEAMSAFSPREGVDAVWPGSGVVYSRRLSTERTKSRLNRIVISPYYKSMTIRNWSTTQKLLEIVKTLVKEKQ